MNQPAGLSIVHPAQAEIYWGERVTGPLQITSDTFLLSTDNCTVRGAFLDAHHLLIEGDCSFSELPVALQSEKSRGRTLLGVRKPRRVGRDGVEIQTRESAALALVLRSETTGEKAKIGFPPQ
jgi:hypothetical protein